MPQDHSLDNPDVGSGLSQCPSVQFSSDYSPENESQDEPLYEEVDQVMFYLFF